jgi:hypothetical protein
MLNFSVSHGIWRFIFMFTKTHYWAQSGVCRIHTTFSQSSFFVRTILILPSYLHPQNGRSFRLSNQDCLRSLIFSMRATCPNIQSTRLMTYKAWKMKEEIWSPATDLRDHQTCYAPSERLFLDEHSYQEVLALVSVTSAKCNTRQRFMSCRWVNMQILFRVQWATSLTSVAFNCSYYLLEMCSYVAKELPR